jgi:2-hydroxychromene-2-carboxylate isomerase
MCTLFPVTLNRPKNFPVNTFFAQSVLRLISLESPSNLDLAIQALFEAVWHHNQSVEKAEEIKKILQDKGIKLSDSELTALVEKGVSKEQRTLLSKESEDLAGCFGMP